MVLAVAECCVCCRDRATSLSSGLSDVGHRGPIQLDLKPSCNPAARNGPL